MKIGPMIEAVNAFRRAVELLPPDQNEHWDAVVKLSEIYLLVAREQKPVLDEVEKFCEQLLKRDANSFDGHRLKGDLHMARSVSAYQVARKEEAVSLLQAAVEEYSKANSIKGNEEGVLMQLARAHSALSEFDKAEALYRQVIDRN